MRLLPVLGRLSTRPPSVPASLPSVGWREWLELPELGIKHVKAKVDTGARSSSLHAEDIEIFQSRGHVKVRFVVLPLQRSRVRAVTCEAVLHDERYVKSSNGQRELRPVIRTAVGWKGQSWAIDVTLTSRDLMGFRMLLGREAVRQRFVVDAGRSFLGGRPKKKKKKSGKARGSR
jgi:hypothetical protein